MELVVHATNKWQLFEIQKPLENEQLSGKHEIRKNCSIPRFLIFLAILSKDLGNFFNRVPIARSGRNAEELLDFAEITDCLHLPSIKAQNESVLNRDYLEQPVVGRGQTERKRRWRCESFCEDVYEPGYVRVRGLF